MDKETLLALLPFIDNPKEVLEKIKLDVEADRQTTDPYSPQNIQADEANLFQNLNAQNASQNGFNGVGATIPNQSE